MQTSDPQHSPSLVQVLPVPRQPQVPWLLHTLGSQQSALLLQPWPPVAQPHTPFRHWPLQQSEPVEQESPSIAQLPPPVPPSPPEPLLSTHLLVLESHV